MDVQNGPRSSFDRGLNFLAPLNVAHATVDVEADSSLVRTRQNCPYAEADQKADLPVHPE